MSMDLPPKLWLPPKPAIIRPAPVQKANFLPGMFPAIFGSAAPAVLTTLAFHASATSTTDRVTAPATVTAGDLLLYMDRGYDNNSAPPDTTPDDFTAATTGFDGNLRHRLSYKIADGSEASTDIIGMNAETNNNKILAVFRGDAAITSVTAGDPHAQATVSNPAAQTLLSGSGTPPLIAVAGYGTNPTSGAVDPRTFNDGSAVGTEISNGTRHYFKYQIYNTSPNNVSIDMDDEGILNSLISCYFACS